MTQKTGLPMWFVLLAAVALLAGIGAQISALSTPDSAPQAQVCDSWLIRDVIEANPAPGVGRVVFQREGQLYQHDFQTARQIGAEVLLRLDFDCAGARLATTEIEQ